MTPADAIAILDAKIADIKAKINSAPLYNSPIRNYIGNPGDCLKKDVIKTLQKIGGRESTLQSIASVSFESRFSGYFAGQVYGHREAEAGLEQCFQRASMQSYPFCNRNGNISSESNKIRTSKKRVPFKEVQPNIADNLHRGYYIVGHILGIHDFLVTL